MSNIITKAHPVPDMHSTGLRVVGAWLFAIVLILFSTVFVHVPYTREIQMVLAIPVLLFFGAPFYAGAWMLYITRHIIMYILLTVKVCMTGC